MSIFEDLGRFSLSAQLTDDEQNRTPIAAMLDLPHPDNFGAWMDGANSDGTPASGNGNQHTVTTTTNPWQGVQPYLTGGSIDGGSGTVDTINGKPIWGPRDGIARTGTVPGVLPEAARLYRDRQVNYDFYPGQTYANFDPTTLDALGMMSGRVNREYGNLDNAGKMISDTMSGDYFNQDFIGSGNLKDTAEGKYLGGGQFMDAYGDDIRDSVNSQFGRGGRSNSLYHSGNVTKQLSNAASRLYDNERNRQMTASQMGSNLFNAERGRQIQSAGLAPSIDSTKATLQNSDIESLLQAGYINQEQAQKAIDESMARHDFDMNRDQDLLSQYANLITSVNAGVPATSSQTSPIYQNMRGQMLGGAMQGAGAGAQFGPWGALIGAGVGALGARRNAGG